jgi:hypothetical protein
VDRRCLAVVRDPASVRRENFILSVRDRVRTGSVGVGENDRRREGIEVPAVDEVVAHDPRLRVPAARRGEQRDREQD